MCLQQQHQQYNIKENVIIIAALYSLTFILAIMLIALYH